MASLIQSLATDTRFDSKLCVTGQHRGMLDQVLELFKIHPEFDLNIMKADQNMADVTIEILQGMMGVFAHFHPDIILVHGDTATTFSAALAAFYNKIPVAHIEAGLRTGDLYSPWPEEANRKLTGALATLHFAPTETSRQNLLREGVDPSSIEVTGNTVIDTLIGVVEKLEVNTELQQQLAKQFYFLADDRRVMLVTGHRRDNFGDGFERICQALIQTADAFPDVDIVFPVHLNPNVREPVNRLLGGMANIYLIEPLDYLQFIYLIKRSYLVLTDSGGIQEEAPYLGVPVLVIRNNTERPEAVEAGTVKLVGTEVATIVSNLNTLLTDSDAYQKINFGHNPYGDGKASSRILQSLATMSEKQRLAPVIPNVTDAHPHPDIRQLSASV